MRAVILAAGLGWRLGEQGRLMPKSLLEFGGESLFARHVRLLSACGIEEVTIGVGYQAQKMRDAAAALSRVGMSVNLIENDRYQLGNVVTLWTLRDALTYGGPVLLMDADVLYDARMLRRLINSKAQNCFLLDREFEPGDEPVKLCVRGGVPVEFAKTLPEGLQYDQIGESVGFFKLSADAAAELAARTGRYIDSGATEAMYEAVLREQVLADPSRFGFEDVTGLPWIEIDFPEDVRKAATLIWEQLEEGGVPAETLAPSIGDHRRRLVVDTPAE